MSRRIPALLLVPLAVWAWAMTQDTWSWSVSGSESAIGLAARSYLRYGIGPLKGGMVLQGGQLSPEEIPLHYYTHHFPIPSLAAAAAFRVLGESHAVLRLTAALFSLLALLNVLAILRRTADPVAAATGLAYLALAPMTLYRGMAIDHEPLALAAITTALRGWLAWQQDGSARGRLAFVLGGILACLVSWSGYFLVLAAALWHLVRRDRAALKPMALLAGGATLVLLLFALHVYWLRGAAGFLDSWASLRMRAGHVGWIPLARTTLQRLILLYPAAGGILALAGVGELARSARGIPGLVSIALLQPILYTLLLPNLAAPPSHEYMAMYFGPGLAVLAGLGASRLWRGRARWAVPLLLLACLAQDAAFTARRFSQRNGYPMANHLGRFLPGLSAPSDRLVTPLADVSFHMAYRADRCIQVDETLTTPEALGRAMRLTPRGRAWTHLVLADPDTLRDHLEDGLLRSRPDSVLATFNVGPGVEGLRRALMGTCPVRRGHGLEVYDLSPLRDAGR